MFSVIIPTLNNIEYLKICLNSLKKNSKFKHEIIIHVNEGSDGTYDYVNNNKLIHTYTKENVGLCTGTNLASKKATTNYILYTHDDMYFCPGWDVCLINEINKINTKLFYFSGTMIQKDRGHINIDCGETYKDFNEKKLLQNYNKIEFYDHQGSHWAPHLIHKDVWTKIGEFSDEFNPGFGSDPDLNMKLWKNGVRIFKGISKFRIYHFGSIVLRKKKGLKTNKGTRIFLLKWGITVNFFKRFYLKTGINYDGPLKEPKKNLVFCYFYILCKMKFLITKIHENLFSRQN